MKSLRRSNFATALTGITLLIFSPIGAWAQTTRWDVAGPAD